MSNLNQINQLKPVANPKNEDVTQDLYYNEILDFRITFGALMLMLGTEETLVDKAYNLRCLNQRIN